jgi:hypothetical protein
MFPKTLKNSPKYKLYPCVPIWGHVLATVTGNFSNLLAHGMTNLLINYVHMATKEIKYHVTEKIQSPFACDHSQ